MLDEVRARLVRERHYRGAGRVAFLARLDDIRKLLDAGHPLRAIYKDFADHLGIGYPQFTRYVGKYIRTEAGK
ncbi:TraK family protein [Escherichia coli]|nr:hypothetical protein [Salmonella enterica subsp. enterica serovar Berta]ELL8195824.1 hypothetical protein [Salmonella enterica]EMA5506095.1 hypothetical protein [Salmonella enterica]MCJ1170176.1 TraK family protein [Escherichia coli]